MKKFIALISTCMLLVSSVAFATPFEAKKHNWTNTNWFNKNVYFYDPIDIDDTVDLTGAVLLGASPLVLEGTTANAYETTFAVTDPTADRTITIPNASGTLFLAASGVQGVTNAVAGIANGFEWEGATADAYETQLTATDPTADRAILLPDAGGVLLVSTGGARNNTNAMAGITGGLEWEGATANAYETSLTTTDPTADRAILLPDAAGVVLVSTGGAQDNTNAVAGTTNGFIWEGATANDYETTVTAADPTADNAIVLPDAAGTVLLSTGGARNNTNGVAGITGGFEFEGATADAYELSITADDATADRAVTFPDTAGTVMISSLSGNRADYTNSVWGASNALNFEGATADDYETTIAPTDATADRTATLPDATGTIAMTTGAGANQTVTPNTASYTLLPADCGKVFTNQGASGEITFTCDSTTAGFYATFANTDSGGYTVNVDPAGTVTILGETNSAGDKVQSTTVGDVITIEIVSSTQAISRGGFGTWADAN